ncbi:MAG: hypothetical protein B9S28_06060 [Opitutia bacterium Tous-C10FEB]|nr:MAG: hypothetical protein B9S28_06060 [Opitutae bacterium Tous-C10FEB]
MEDGDDFAQQNLTLAGAHREFPWQGEGEGVLIGYVEARRLPSGAEFIALLDDAIGDDGFDGQGGADLRLGLFRRGQAFPFERFRYIIWGPQIIRGEFRFIRILPFFKTGETENHPRVGRDALKLATSIVTPRRERQAQRRQA